jgi:hypothetical protein
MSSGRIQLASIGIQDYFLTSNPDITYFQKVFKKHTSFALETLDNSINGDTIDFGSELRCVIPRRGDLIRNIYLKIQLPELSSTLGSNIGYTDSIGNAIIDYADLIIGGQLIERITGEYMEIHNQLLTTDSKMKSLEYLIGTTGNLTCGNATPDNNFPRTFLVPLPFYFYRHEPLVLPICALMRQEIEVLIKLKPLEDLYIRTLNDPSDPASYPAIPPPGTKLGNVSLPVEYVFVQPEEVNYFRSVELNYLITQLQKSVSVINSTTRNPSFRLNFVNPVKEMFFAVQNSNVIASNNITGNQTFNFTNEFSPFESNTQLESLQLNFNGQPIIESEIANNTFMFALQAMLNHTRQPKTEDKRIFFTYSFALDPENFEPTGQINMSRIQNQYLTLNLTGSLPEATTRHIKVYAKSYNILRIKNDLAGLLFIDNNTV